MEIDKVVIRIGHLLALSNSPEKNEALAAAKKAQELMAKYNVSAGDILEKETKELGSVLWKNKNKEEWAIPLAEVIANNFRCKMLVVSNYDIAFYGYSGDVQIAYKIFDFLLEVGFKLREDFLFKNKIPNKKREEVINTYNRYFISGVADELGNNATALALVMPDEVENEFSQMVEELNLNKRRNNLSFREDEQAARNGYKDGKNSISSRYLEGRKIRWQTL